MGLELTTADKQNLIKLFVSCGGTLNRSMMAIVDSLARSKSGDYYESLGGFGEAVLLAEQGRYSTENGPRGTDFLDPLIELAEIGSVKGRVDTEAIIRYFASDAHTRKFETQETAVAAELPLQQRAFAHTLLPLTLKYGRYYYDNGEVCVELEGLVPVGLSSHGTPYAHLASLFFIEDHGFNAQILAEQSKGRVCELARDIEKVSYFNTPKLREATKGALRYFEPTTQKG